MNLDIICRNCKKDYKINTNEQNGSRWNFCTEKCNEEYYLKYRCGFIPRKYKDLPIIDLGEKFKREFKDIADELEF